MAKEITIRNEFFCDEVTFWDEAFFDPEFNRRLFFDLLKFPEWKILSQKDEGKGKSRKLERVMHVTPTLANAPAILQKALGDKFSYDETGKYDGAAHTYELSIKTSTLPDKIRCSGVLHTETLGDKHIVRIAKLQVEVKIFGVGSIAEERFLQDLKTSYEIAANFTQTYLKEKGLWART